jgi:hypothetical protein
MIVTPSFFFFFNFVTLAIITRVFSQIQLQVRILRIPLYFGNLLEPMDLNVIISIKDPQNLVTLYGFYFFYFVAKWQKFAK